MCIFFWFDLFFHCFFYCDFTNRLKLFYHILTVQSLLILYLFLLSCSQTRFFRTACTQAPFSRCALTTHDAASSLGVTLESHSLWSCGPYSSRLCWRDDDWFPSWPRRRPAQCTLHSPCARRFVASVRGPAAQVFHGSYLLVLADRDIPLAVPFFLLHTFMFIFFIFAAAVCVVFFCIFFAKRWKTDFVWRVLLMLLLLLLLICFFFTPLVWCALFSQCCFLLFVPLSCSFKADRFSIKKGAFFTHCWFCESCCIFSPLSFALLIILCCVFLFPSSYFFILLSFFSSVRQVW